MPQKLKRREHRAPRARVRAAVADLMDVASAKEKDFDLDLDAVRFKGQKGQAGSRTRAGGP